MPINTGGDFFLKLPQPHTQKRTQTFNFLHHKATHSLTLFLIVIVSQLPCFSSSLFVFVLKRKHLPHTHITSHRNYH